MTLKSTPPFLKGGAHYEIGDEVLVKRKAKRRKQRGGQGGGVRVTGCVPRPFRQCKNKLIKGVITEVCEMTTKFFCR